MFDVTGVYPTQSIAGMELDMTEEDQMMRAIAMSLGENVVMSTDQPTQANVSYISSPLNIRKASN